VIASEAHFLGEPCAHVVAYYEHLRMQRIQRSAHRAFWTQRGFAWAGEWR